MDVLGGSRLLVRMWVKIIKRTNDGKSIAGSLGFMGNFVSNQGSNFWWCKGGVNAVFAYRKVVAALWDFKFLYCVAMADE